MNRRLIHPFGAGLVATLLFIAGCATSKPGESAAGDGVSGGVASSNAGPATNAGSFDEANFHELWSDVLPLNPGDSATRLFADQDLVVACTPQNVIYAIAKPSGVLQFFDVVNGGGGEVGSPVVLPKRLVFTGEANVEVYTRATGELERSIPLDFSISSHAVAGQGDVYFGANTAGGQLADINLDAKSNLIRWRLMMFGQVLGKPAFYSGVIYAGSANGNVYAINNDRTPVWPLDHDRFDTDAPIVGDIKADEDGVYVASTSGRLVCLDRNTGKLKWQYLCPQSLETGPFVTRTTVYELVPGQGLVALSKSDPIQLNNGSRRKIDTLNRDPRWTCPQAAQFVCETRQYTFVRTTNNELWALDRLTGQVRYRGIGGPGKTMKFAIYATNITDDTIYAITRDGVVLAFKPLLAPGTPGFVE